MNFGKTLPWFEMRLSVTILLLAVLFTNCQDNSLQVPTKDEFTKEKREAFGKMMANDVISNYSILPEDSPYDSLYWYIQTLYNQASSIIQLDKQSPVDNRWNPDREWKVSVIENDEMKHAFALPGGDLFISTGLLRSFEREYEFFYLLTFEAALMAEGHLLERLIEEYNSLTINNLIEGRATGNETTIYEVASTLPTLVFDDGIVELTDEETVASICTTSILEPTGINNVLLDGSFQPAEWLKTRPSYSNRPAKILDFSNQNAADCGSSIGMGNYQKFVLDVLN